MISNQKLALRSLILPLSLWLMCVSCVSANEILIDFESFPGPDGELGTMDDVPVTAPELFAFQPDQLTSEFAPLGISFLPNPSVDNQNEILDDSSFLRTTGSSPNLLSTQRADVVSGGGFPFGPIEAEFTSTVFSVSMAIGLGTGIDIPPNLLEIFDSSENLIGSVVGSDEVVSIDSTVPIHRFRVTSTESQWQAAIDDIRFTAVPEPAAVLSGWLALLALIASSRKRN